jgi:hypothetical protein
MLNFTPKSRSILLVAVGWLAMIPLSVLRQDQVRCRGVGVSG